MSANVAGNDAEQNMNSGINYGFKAGTVALVTGAATGIGLACALTFARAGCDLVVADVDAVRGEEAAEAVRALGRRAKFIACDVADTAQVEALHAGAVAEFGRLDCAVNNAGISGESVPTADCSLENFDRVISVNLRGTFMCLRAQLRVMREQQGGGAICNISSISGLVGFPNLPAYSASKAGVIQMTKTASLEYADKGVRVNAVCPGVIRTEMIDRITHKDAAVEASFDALHPVGRMGTPDEVARSVVFLCSPHASFITGSANPIDGGFTAK